MNSNLVTATATAPISAPAHLIKRLAALPPCAIAKYERLRRAHTKARAIIDGLQTEIDRVREERASAQRDLAIYDRHNPGERFTYEETGDGTSKRVPARDEHREGLVALVESATAELARLQEEVRAVAIPNVQAIERWIAEQDPKAKFVPAVFPAAKVGKNETLASALERSTTDQRRIADEIATVRNSPRTKAEARAAMRAEIARLAARGRPVVDGLFAGDGIKWPTLQVIGSGHGAHPYAVASEIADSLGLFAWFHRDALAAALDKEIEAEAGDDADALSAEDKAALVFKLGADLLVLQRQAETLIDRLEGDGIPVQRTCWDPLVVLGIERARS